MKVLHGTPWSWPIPDGGRGVAVGVFDGVHRGHRHVLDLLGQMSENRDLEPAVLTFDPHPLEITAPDRAPRLLSDIRLRLELFDEAGVEVVGVLPFDPDVRELSPTGFATEVLAERLGARLVVVGEDFRFGKDRTGHVGLLRELGDAHGFEVHVVPLVGGEAPVSSSAIRVALLSGDVAAAIELLGHPHEVAGSVEAGEGRGSTIGVPTANLEVSDRIVVPGRGVYAVRGRPEADDWVPGVANIGVRPTFGGGNRETVEVHLLDWSGDLYGQELRVRFVERIRDEQVFGSAVALVEQIRSDIEAARVILQGD